MTDHSEGDKGKEAVMDFELSWVLRMASDKGYTKDKPIFTEFSRFMLFKLLGKPFPNAIEIVCVKVWKEWADIDVCAEVTIRDNGVDELHVLLIENKVYTKVRDNQLVNYPMYLKEAYRRKDIEGYFLHQIIITCTESESELNELKALCKNTEWTVMSIYDIIYDINKETESELFNEFWLYYWGRLTDNIK